MTNSVHFVAQWIRIMAARHSLNLLTTSTALVALLAACGGGGGSQRDKIVSSSPLPPTTLNSAVTTPTPPATTPARNGTPPTSQPSTPTNGVPNTSPPAPVGPPNQTATNPPPASPAPRQSETLPAIPPTPTPAPSPATIPNVSGKGVRGDVLLAMFEQNRCATWTNSTTSYDGPVVEDYQAIGIASVRMAATLTAGNYTSDPNFWIPVPIPEESQRCGKRYYSPVVPGTYQYILYSKNDYRQFRYKPLYGEPWIKRGFNSLEVSYTVNITADTLEIGPYPKVKIEEDLGYLATSWDSPIPQGNSAQPWFGSTSVIFRRDQEVPFGTLQEWSDHTGAALRLMLIKGGKKDEVKLCTNADLSFVKRLQCTVWHIPADWKWGQELKTPEGYIVDDRSVYPNESGMLYWRATN